MTPEESVRFYEDRQAYFDKCEAFKEEVRKFFENYKPKNITHNGNQTENRDYYANDGRNLPEVEH